MEIIQYIIDNYNLFTNIIENLQIEAIDTLNKNGGF
jgi:hypothetical protein